jgi:multiple sugar transport system permease protein
MASSRSRLATREALDGYLYASPFILGFLLWIAYPMAYSVWLVFQDWDLLSPPLFAGLDNLAAMAADEKVGIALLNTAFYAFLGVPLHLALAFLLALALNAPLRGRAFFRTAFYMPAIVPAVPSIALFIWILHDRFGLLNEFLFNTFHIAGPGWLTAPEWTKPSLILWALWNVGGGMIIWLAGLQGVPQGLYEAAAIDGAGVLARFRHVTLPMLSPTLFFVLTMGVIGSFQVFTPVFLLGSNNYAQAAAGPLDSLLFWVVHIYNNGFFFFKMGYASALAWIIFVIIVFFTATQFWLSRRWVYYEGGQT